MDVQQVILDMDNNSGRNDIEKLFTRSTVAAVEKIDSGEIRDICQKRCCERIATHYITYRLEIGEKMTFRKCDDHLPDEVRDSDGEIIEFGEVYIGEGPGQVNREYMLSVQRAEQFTIELIEKLHQLQAADYLDSEEVAFIEQCIDAIPPDNLVTILGFDHDDKFN